MVVTSSRDKEAKINEFLEFLNESWTAFHAVAEARRMLINAGFEELNERECCESKLRRNVIPDPTLALVSRWKGKYFLTRNGSALVAFAVGGQHVPGETGGFTIIGAHTDSPCPKLKPKSKCQKEGYLMLSVQPYGGGLWHTWYDRDLSLAGRCVVKKSTANGNSVCDRLVKINRPVCRIPNLAIHLLKGDKRQTFKPNMQDNGFPVFASAIKAALECTTPPKDEEEKEKTESKIASASDLHHPLLLKLLAKELECDPQDIVDFELQLCDTQPSQRGGAAEEFIFSGRLDNLCSSWQSIAALIDSASSLGYDNQVRMVCLFDNEEVGSESAYGARSTLLPETISRVTSALGRGVESAHTRALRRSFVVSADMAHAIHPNYARYHDPDHAPSFHKGMVLKTNANQRYATNLESGYIFKEIGRRVCLPTQEFAVRADTGCGSTIGPMVSALTGVSTVDVGSPQWSMHSIREMMGVDDVEMGYLHLKAVFELFSEVDSQLNVQA